MTGKSGLRVVVVCFASFGLGAALGEETVAPQSSAQAQPAKAPSLAQLRKDLRKAEDRFNALYNKLNPRTEEHVTCTRAADTGSRLAKRSCSTVGEREALARDALDYMAGASDNAALAGQGADSASASPVDSAITASAAGQVASATVGGNSEVQARRDAYRRNLDKLLEEHADLRQALQQYTVANQRYELALRSR